MRKLKMKFRTPRGTFLAKKGQGGAIINRDCPENPEALCPVCETGIEITDTGYNARYKCGECKHDLIYDSDEGLVVVYSA